MRGYLILMLVFGFGFLIYHQCETNDTYNIVTTIVDKNVKGGETTEYFIETDNGTFTAYRETFTKLRTNSEYRLEISRISRRIIHYQYIKKHENKDTKTIIIDKPVFNDSSSLNIY